MDYVGLIQDTIDYIETHLDQDLSLEGLAERACLSRFHFQRLFRAVTSRTLKEYVEERRMAASAFRLLHGREKIIEVALAAGYQSHEVFSRRFHDHFSLTPMQYRQSAPQAPLPEKLQVIQREFTNRGGGVVPAFRTVALPRMEIACKSITFNPETSSGLKQASAFVQRFVYRHVTPHRIPELYCISAGTPENGILFRSGYPAPAREKLDTFTLPASRYAVFRYHDEMSDIFQTIFVDICRALIAGGETFNKTGIEFFHVYGQNYLQDGYHIYVPIL